MAFHHSISALGDKSGRNEGSGKDTRMGEDVHSNADDLPELRWRNQT